MNILIFGSGLLGVSTAYELGKRGFDVTVLDRQATSGAESSYANGAQLSYSHAEPWAIPGVLPKLPKWIFHPESPLVVHPRADWQMIKWGLQFLRNCTHARADRNCANILRLGLYSKTQFERIRKETEIEFDYNNRGILHVFDNEKEFDAAKHHNDFQAKFGGEERPLNRQETLDLEPTLTYTPRSIVGGMHAFRDECGDAYLYCNALAKIAAERHGVKFQYGVNIKDILTEGDRIVGVSTDQGELSADGFVMALGCYSSVHLRKIGINVPIYPMKGYSVTIEADDYCPMISVTDISYKIVHTRIGDRLRVAGTAEFAGYNDRMNERRIRPIMRAARSMFPKINWDQELQKWACLRPSTPDGPPILGRTPYRNLFLNTGHGTLGWTQAAGSAAIVADMMEGKNPAIMLHGLTLR
jgi:D-amino-acid dehydrogenase